MTILGSCLVAVLLLSSATLAVIHNDGACPLLSMIPFSDGLLTSIDATFNKESNYDKPWARWTPETIGLQGFGYMAAAQMAIDHFNARDTAVVPELKDLTDCDIYIPYQDVFDSHWDTTEALRGILDATQRDKLLPCSILGPAADAAVTRTASIAAAYRIPQLSYYSYDQSIRTAETPFTFSTSLTLSGLVRAIVTYLQRPRLERDFLAILYEDLPRMRDIATEISESGKIYGLTVTSITEKLGGVPIVADTDWEKNRALSLKQTGYRTIFLMYPFTDKIAKWAQVFHDEGMLTNEYVYILLEDVAPIGNDISTVYDDVVPGSPLDLLLSGALVISRMDGFTVDGNQDRFLTSWRSQNSTLVERLNSLTPLSPNQTEYFQGSGDYFQTHMPPVFSSYVYDSVMMAGFGACRLRTGKLRPPGDKGVPRPTGGFFDKDGNPPLGMWPPGGQIPPPGGWGPPFLALDPQIRGIFESNFTGASGYVSFFSLKWSRTVFTVPVGAFNIQPVEKDSGLRTYKSVLTARITKTHWEEIQPFIYRDGTTVSPTLLREIFEENYISPWVRAVGFILLGFAWFQAFGSMALLWYFRDNPVVKASQVPFLQLLCVGSIITSTSIFLLSWDESYGWSNNQLDIACALTPWFFFIGHIVMFSALFSKLWRVDRVFQFRRARVKIIHVLWPLILLLITTTMILCVWTVMDPWNWTRILINSNPPETYGECTSVHFAAFFSVLCGVIVFAELITFLMAWKTADIPREFRDSSAVFYSIAAHLQAWFVGLPILLVLGNDSVDATYIGRVMIIWIFSVCPVSLVILPKIYKSFHGRPSTTTNARVRITGWEDPYPSSGQFVAQRSSQPASNGDSANIGSSESRVCKSSNGDGSAHNNGSILSLKPLTVDQEAE